MHQLTVNYAGRVQGVGFRYTVRSIATDLGLAGWVRNNDDGTVTMLAEGTEDVLTVLRRRIRESGVGRIDSERDTLEERSAGMRSFEIVS